ncbi:MAG: DUF3048 domain-containing protein [Patescibacteria group bacterium]
MDDNQIDNQPLKVILNTDRRRLFIRISLGLIALIVIYAGIVAWFRYGGQDTSSQTNQRGDANNQPTVTTASSTPTLVTDNLDGTQVAAPLANRRPLGVMIENHPDARPQFGLGQASVVYEAIAEGGITRFLAIFGANDVAKVGPVRSARSYYLDWALEYDAAYAHVGGNIDALDLIKQLAIHDLDQFALGTRAYRREPRGGVALEHTMYADTNALRTIDLEKYGSNQDWTKPTFKADEAREHRPTSQVVNIDFSSPDFTVRWTYDPETNTYLRQMGGVPHKDGATGDTLRAANIFVQTVQRAPIVTRINEHGYKMDTVGTGSATVFQDGKKIEATWKKASHTAPTVFTDAEGKVIARNPGVTWFEIVPPESTVTSE